MKFFEPRKVVWGVSAALAMIVAAITVAQATAEPAAAPSGKSSVLKTVIEGIPHSAFFGISFDAGKGVAVGAGGSIFESADAGVTWKPVPQTFTELAFLSVDKRGPHTVAVGQMGVVAIEESPGKWTKIETGDTARLFSVSVNTAGLAVTVGEFGKVLKSEDGGKTWTSAAPDWSSFADQDSFGTGEPSMFSAYVSESGEITIAGEYGVMLRSTDKGASWRTLRPVKTGQATIFAMSLVPEGQGNSYAVGQEGELMESTDGGVSWSTCDVGTVQNFLGVAASPNGQVVVTGMRVMMRSSNAGHTWEPVEEGDITTDWYQAVRTEASSGRIMAVGHSGKIIQIGG